MLDMLEICWSRVEWYNYFDNISFLVNTGMFGKHEVVRLATE